jgi:DNA-binding CsgD family transcriptional regulator
MIAEQRKNMLLQMVRAGKPIEEIVAETGYSLAYASQIVSYVAPLLNPDVYRKQRRLGRGSCLSPENQDRRDEMRRLRFEERLSLQKISDRFGISRERVRQIIGNSGPKNGGFQFNQFYDTLCDPGWLAPRIDKTNREIAEELEVSVGSVSMYRGSSRHAIEPESVLGKGARAEEVVSDKLWRRGIPNKLMPVHHPYDILVGGQIKIDVKSAYKPSYPTNPSMVNPQYRFGVRSGKKREDADYYILIIVETEDYFIVPAKDVPIQQQSLTFCWPTERPEIGKWQNYHDAWDLIEDAIEKIGT